MADDIQQAPPESPITPQNAPQTQLVNVIDPDTQEVGSIPHSQLQEAMAQGYTQASPEAVHKFVTEQKYGGFGEQLKSAAEGAADAATFGGSTVAEVATGLAKPEDIRGRREAGPGHTIGQIAGLAATALIPGAGEANAMRVAGTAAKAINPLSAASILTGAGRAGAEALGVGKTAMFGDQIAGAATKAALENALFQGGSEVSRAAITEDLAKNPEKFAETAIANIGMATVLGGVFGGALGVASQGLKKTFPKTFISQVDVPKLEAGDLETAVKVDETLSPTMKDKILGAINVGKRKANWKEIEAAKDILGAPETPGMYLEHPAIETHVDALSHSPYTISGNRVRGRLDAAYSAVDSRLEEATQSANKLSKDQLGTELGESLEKDIRTAYAPQKAAFDELAATHEQVPVTPDAVMRLRQSLGDIKEVKLSASSAEGRLVRGILKAADNVKTADDINTLRNMAELKNPGVGKDPLGWLKGKIRDSLTEMQEDAVKKYSKSFPRNDEAGALMASLVERAEAAKAGYAPYIKKLGTLSEWLGKGKIHGTEDALHFMNERLSASELSQRLFSSSKDPQFIRFFSKEFPEQFSKVRDYQRMALRDSVTTGDEFSAKRFFNKFNALEPEVQKALYSAEEIKKIEAAETYIRGAFPKNFNPSGTAHVMAHRLAHETPKSMLLANARDYAMEKLINAVGNMEARNASELGKATVKGDNQLKAGIQSVFKAGKSGPVLAVSNSQREKLDKLVIEYTQNPEKMMEIGANNPVPEYNTAFAQAAARSVQYLNSIRPDKTPKGILDSKVAVNDQQKSEYNRALNLAQQPLLVLERIKNGTITPKDVAAVSAMYPSLYNKMIESLNTEMITTISKGGTVPYKQRIGLSIFMGQPIDSTMTPQAIVGAQPLPTQQPSAQSSGGSPKRGTASLSKLPGQYQTPDQSRAARAAKE